MAVRRRPASNPTVDSRSRSPHTRTAEAHSVVRSFINFTSHSFLKIDLLPDKQVKTETGPIHGFWEDGEDDEELIVWWHWRGNWREVRRHRYAKVASTRAWQLVERCHAIVRNGAFLLPIAQEPTHVPLDFRLHDYRGGSQYWKVLALRADKLVQVDDGLLHGSWDQEEHGDLVVNWHHKSEEDKIKSHRYRKVPYTDAWRLLYRDGRSICHGTILLPMLRQ